MLDTNITYRHNAHSIQYNEINQNSYFTLQFSTDCALAKYVFKKYTEGENLLILSL